MKENNQNYQQNNFRKISFWRLILIGIIVLGLVYVLMYYFFFSKDGGSNQNLSNYQQNEQKVNTNGKNFMIQNMKVEILKDGEGAEAKSGDKVTVNYVGTLEDGTKFDSSIDRNTPFQFTLGEGRVIQGWELGVVGMKVGEKRKLTIPSELGYGADGIGFGGKFGCSGQPDCDPNKETYIISPNATLLFEVDLVKIN